MARSSRIFDLNLHSNSCEVGDIFMNGWVWTQSLLDEIRLAFGRRGG